MNRWVLFPLCAWAALSSAVLASPLSPTWEVKPALVAWEGGPLLLFDKDETSAVTVIQIFIRGGKSAVPDGKDGLAYLTTRLALEITDSGKAQDIMTYSTHLGMTIREDFSFINLACLSEYLEESVKVAAEIIQDPLFSGLRIDNAKKTMIHLAKIDEDDALAEGTKAAFSAFFGGTGYGSVPYGTEAGLKKVDKKDIVGLYKSLFVRGNMVFSVSSDKDKESVLPLLWKYFSKIPPGEPFEPPPPVSTQPEKSEIFIEKDLRQAFVSLAYRLPPISRKAYALGSVLETLLGKGPGSRLWELRAEEKLAYNVNAVFYPMASAGLLQAYLGTDKEKRGVAVERLKARLGDLYDKGADEEELRMAKTLARADFLRSNESKEARARTAGAFEVWGLGVDFLSGFFQEVDGLSLEELNAYLREVLDPGKALCVIVGPATGSPKL